MPDKEQVMEILKNVYDPEIMVSIVDLGLVYGVEIEDDNVYVKMTLTSLGCPLADVIEHDTKAWVRKLKGVGYVDVEFVFDPPWDSSRMSDEAKLLTGHDL